MPPQAVSADQRDQGSSAHLTLPDRGLFKGLTSTPSAVRIADNIQHHHVT